MANYLDTILYGSLNKKVIRNPVKLLRHVYCVVAILVSGTSIATSAASNNDDLSELEDKVYEAVERGDIYKAQNILEKAVSKAAELGSSYWLLNFACDLGFVQTQNGDLENAKRNYEKAIAGLDGNVGEWIEYRCRQGFGTTKLLSGDVDGSLTELTRARLVVEEFDANFEQAQLDVTIASILQRNEADGVLDYLFSAEILAKNVEDPEEEAILKAGIAELWIAIDWLDNANKNYERALELETHIFSNETRASLYRIGGELYSARLEFDKAERFFQLAIDNFSQASSPFHLALTYIGLAKVKDMSSEYTQAAKYWDKANVLAQKSGDPLVIHRARTGALQTDLLSDKFVSTVELENAFESAIKLGDVESIFKYGSMFIMASYETGEIRRAHIALKKLLNHSSDFTPNRLLVFLWDTLAFINADDLRLKIVFLKMALIDAQIHRFSKTKETSSSQGKLLQVYGPNFESLVDALLREGRDTEAVEILRFLRARDLQNSGDVSFASDSRSIAIPQNGLEDTIESYIKSFLVAVQSLNANIDEIRANKSENSGQSLDELQEELISNQTKLFDFAINPLETEDIKRTLQANGDGWSETTVYAHNTLPESIRVLPNKSATIHYFEFENRVYALISNAASTTTVLIPSFADEVRKLASSYQANLKNFSTKFSEYSKKLYDSLIRPLEVHLPSDVEVLYVSPGKELGGISFAALNDGNSFLIEKYALAYLIDGLANSIDTTNRATTMSAFAVSDHGSDLTNLPAVIEEVQAIVKSHDEDIGFVNGEVFLNNAVTSERILKAANGDTSILHFASHFVIDADDISQSFLALGGNQKLYLNQDFFEDINLRGVDMVALSACDTGVGSNDRFDFAIGSMADSFLVAGARRVLATFWPVVDDVAASTMVDFYSEWLDSEKSAPIALQESLKTLIRQESNRPEAGDTNQDLNASNRGASSLWQLSNTHTSPYYWAPYALFVRI